MRIDTVEDIVQWRTDMTLDRAKIAAMKKVLEAQRETGREVIGLLDGEPGQILDIRA